MREASQKRSSTAKRTTESRASKQYHRRIEKNNMAPSFLDPVVSFFVFFPSIHDFDILFASFLPQ